MADDLSATRSVSALYSVFVSNLEFMSKVLDSRSRVKIKFMKINYDNHKTYY
jgi:hypothetical protein